MGDWLNYSCEYGCPHKRACRQICGQYTWSRSGSSHDFPITHNRYLHCTLNNKFMHTCALHNMHRVHVLEHHVICRADGCGWDILNQFRCKFTDEPYIFSHKIASTVKSISQWLSARDSTTSCHIQLCFVWQCCIYYLRA